MLLRIDAEVRPKMDPTRSVFQYFRITNYELIAN